MCMRAVLHAIFYVTKGGSLVCGGTRGETTASPTLSQASGARGGLSGTAEGDGGPLGGTRGADPCACTAMVIPFGLEGRPCSGSLHEGGDLRNPLPSLGRRGRLAPCLGGGRAPESLREARDRFLIHPVGLVVVPLHGGSGAMYHDIIF